MIGYDLDNNSLVEPAEMTTAQPETTPTTLQPSHKGQILLAWKQRERKRADELFDIMGQVD